jgi:hypothetical protein
MQHGVRAMAKVILAYVQRDKIAPTVRAIISRWAPGSENNTGAYIADVAHRMHVDADAPLAVTTPAGVLVGLVTAIIAHEIGDLAAPLVTADDIGAGVQMALSGD